MSMGSATQRPIQFWLDQNMVLQEFDSVYKVGESKILFLNEALFLNGSVPDLTLRTGAF